MVSPEFVTRDQRHDWFGQPRDKIASEGEKGNATQMKARRNVKNDPVFSFTHSLINKLSAISGHSQLVREDLPKDVPEYSRCIERLLLIEKTAHAMAEEVKMRQRELDAIKKAG